MFTRSEVLTRLRATLADGRPIIGAGAGTGISAKFAERGGADLILVYNSGRYRMAGHGSNAGMLPIGDANAVVIEMGEREILPVVENTPVVAGVNGTDPTRSMDRFLETVARTGFSGVINFPSVGYFDGRWRQSLEATGFGYGKEAVMIRKASERGLFTLAYVYQPDETPAMVEAGVDVVVAHVGLTTGGSIGATASSSLDDCVEQTIETMKLAVATNPDTLVLCHGGPMEQPADAEYVITRSGCHGFVGATTMERLPTETAIEETVRGFKDAKLV